MSGDIQERLIVPPTAFAAVLGAARLDIRRPAFPCSLPFLAAIDQFYRKWNGVRVFRINLKLQARYERPYNIAEQISAVVHVADVDRVRRTVHALWTREQYRSSWAVTFHFALGVYDAKKYGRVSDMLVIYADQGKGDV